MATEASTTRSTAVAKTSAGSKSLDVSAKSWREIPNVTPDTNQNTSPPRPKSDFVREMDDFLPGEPVFPKEGRSYYMSSLPKDSPQYRALMTDERDRQQNWIDRRGMDVRDMETNDRLREYTKPLVKDLENTGAENAKK